MYTAQERRHTHDHPQKQRRARVLLNQCFDDHTDALRLVWVLQRHQSLLPRPRTVRNPAPRFLPLATIQKVQRQVDHQTLGLFMHGSRRIRSADRSYPSRAVRPPRPRPSASHRSVVTSTSTRLNPARSIPRESDANVIEDVWVEKPRADGYAANDSDSDSALAPTITAITTHIMILHVYRACPYLQVGTVRVRVVASP